MKKYLKMKQQNICKFIKQNIIIFVIFLIFLIVALLSFWPGIFTIDGNVQWKQVSDSYIINNHPFFSTFIWWMLSKIWFSPTVLLIFQMVLLSAIWTFICYSLANNHNFKKRIIYTIFISFIPIIFFYSITAWKDIIYSYMLLFIAIMIYNGIKKEFNYSYWDLFAIDIALAFVWSYRYNGIIVSILIILALVIVLAKHKISIKKIISFIAMFILILGIFKIPEKIMCHPQTNQAGNDIALFIIASLVKEDKIDNIEDLNIINEVYSIDKLKEEYYPYVINSMSFSKYYNRENAQIYSKDIIRILVKYTFKHPFTVIKHYLKADNLLIGLRYGDGYVYIYQFDYWETKYSGNFDGMVQPIFKKGYDLYSKIINLTTGNITLRKFYLPAYSLYGSIVLMIIYAKKTKDKRLLLVLIPMIFNTFSLLPINIAQDLRYVYINYLTLIMLVMPLFVLKYPRKIEIKGKIKKINKNKLKTLIIIPAYNESKSIKKVIENVYSQNIENCDVIVINDGSKDNTYEMAKKTKAIVIDCPNNLGIGGAVQTGYLYAKKYNYDIAIQIDGDGQHNPKYLKNFIEEIKNGNDLVIGSRFIENTGYNQTISRMLGINIISCTIKAMTGMKISDTTSGYRAANRNIIEEFAEEYPYDYPEPCTNMRIIKRGYMVKEIPVEMNQRETGVSSISTLKGIIYMFKVTLSILLMGLKN